MTETASACSRCKQVILLGADGKLVTHWVTKRYWWPPGALGVRLTERCPGPGGDERP
jgi:hypothetical protein